MIVRGHLFEKAWKAKTQNHSAIERVVDGMVKTSFRSLKEPPGVGPPLMT